MHSSSYCTTSTTGSRTCEACGIECIVTCGITPHPNGSGSEKVSKSSLGAEYLIHNTYHVPTTQQALLELKQKQEQQNQNNNNINNNKLLVVALETTNVSKLYTEIDYRPYYHNNNDDDDNGNNNKISTDNNNNSSSAPSKSAAGGGIVVILGNEVTGVDPELLSPLLLLDEEKEVEKTSSESTIINTNINTTATSTASSLSLSSSSLIDLIVELPTYGQKNSLNVAAVAPVILYEILRQWNE